MALLSQQLLLLCSTQKEASKLLLFGSTKPCLVFVCLIPGNKQLFVEVL